MNKFRAYRNSTDLLLAKQITTDTNSDDDQGYYYKLEWGLQDDEQKKVFEHTIVSGII